MGRIVRDLLALQCDGDRFGNSPHEAYQLTRNGYDPLVGMFPTRNQLTVPFTEPDLGFPTDVLNGFGLFFQSEPTFKGLWQCIENFPVTTAVSKA
jgi:hypothetical protein